MRIISYNNTSSLDVSRATLEVVITEGGDYGLYSGDIPIAVDASQDKMIKLHLELCNLIRADKVTPMGDLQPKLHINGEWHFIKYCYSPITVTI